MAMRMVVHGGNGSVILMSKIRPGAASAVTTFAAV